MLYKDGMGRVGSLLKVLNSIQNGDVTLLGEGREKHITAMRHAYKAMVEAT